MFEWSFFVYKNYNDNPLNFQTKSISNGNKFEQEKSDPIKEEKGGKIKKMNKGVDTSVQSTLLFFAVLFTT